jgi:hypothetical protein
MTRTAIIAAALLALAGPAKAEGPCTDLVIASIGGRLQGDPANKMKRLPDGTLWDTGVSISYALPGTGYVQA